MTHPASPAKGCCARCQQPRIVHLPDPAWGKVAGPLCTPCWQTYATARDQNSYVDWDDAFDNASDAEIIAQLTGRNTP